MIPQLFLELLVCLFADPPRLDCRREFSERNIRRQVRHIIFLLARGSPFADKPDLVAGRALGPTIRHADFAAIRHADTPRDKQACKPAFRAPPPTDPLPFLPRQNGFGRNRRLIRKRVFAGLAGLRDRKNQRNVGRIDCLFPRLSYGPKEAALTQCLSKRAAGSVTRISKHTAKTRPGRDDMVNLFNGYLRLRQSYLTLLRHAGPHHTLDVACPGFRQEQTQPDHHRHFA